MVVAVVFKGDLTSKKYNYRCNDFKVRPMDKVLVPVGNYGHVEVATIVAVWLEEVDGQYGSIPSFDLKSVIAPADAVFLRKQMEIELENVQENYLKLLSKLG